MKNSSNQTRAKEVHTCRSCGGKLRLVLSLGKMPIVNTFPLAEDLRDEKKMPLRLSVCPVCHLVQLAPILAKTEIFDRYHYASGASTPLIKHLEKLALEIDGNLPEKRGKILDIGCNDGTLLMALSRKGRKVLGIDPAATVVQLARAKGLPVICDFFTKKSAGRIRRDYGLFDVVVITHTLANIVDLQGFFAGVLTVLAPHGTVVIEVGSLAAMLEKGQFDAIYHEHYSYFSEESLTGILQKNGFVVTRLERNDFHGGALRIFATKNSQDQRSKIKDQKENEKSMMRELREFAKGVRAYRKEFRTFLASLRGKKVVGFGAPAKGVTLLNYCGIGRKEIAYIVDSTLMKQGRYVPGVQIPVFPEDMLWNDPIPPAYILLLSWNYKEEIVTKLKKHFSKKTKVILPFPKPASRQLG